MVGVAKMGPKIVVITEGPQGSNAYDGKDIWRIGIIREAPVVERTGAGDSFAGGLIGYLARTDSLSFNNMKTAIIYGSTMASFCVENFSLNRLKSLKQEEIQARLHQFRDLSSFETKELPLIQN